MMQFANKHQFKANEQAASVIIPRKIHRTGAFALEPAQDVLVEFAGAVVAHFFEALVHGSGFDDDGDVAARLYRDFELGHFDTEDIHGEFIHADAVVDFVWIPVFQLDDELDLLFIANGADAEEVGYIDNSEAADFHVVADDFVCALPHEQRAIETADFDDIVSDKPVPPLDKCERCLALAYAGFAQKQNTNAKYLDQNAMHDNFRSKYIVQNPDDTNRKFHRTQRSNKHGAACCVRGFCKVCSWLNIVGKNTAGHLIRKQLCVYRPIDSIGFDFIDVGAFAPAENLQPFPCEGIVKACKRQTRPIEIWHTDLAGQPGSSCDTAQ